jgi:hypothetical protein
VGRAVEERLRLALLHPGVIGNLDAPERPVLERQHRGVEPDDVRMERGQPAQRILQLPVREEVAEVAERTIGRVASGHGAELVADVRPGDFDLDPALPDSREFVGSGQDDQEMPAAVLAGRAYVKRAQQRSQPGLQHFRAVEHDSRL